MALILIEGFDHEATSDYSQGGAGNRMIEKGWALAGEGPINFVTPGRLPYSGNSSAMTVIQNNPLVKVFPATYTSFVLGFGIYFQPQVFGSGAGFNFLQIGLNGAVKLTLGYSFSFQLQVFDSTGTLKATGPTQIPLGNWNYIELKMTSTHVEVHLNGVSGEIPSTAGTFGSMNYFLWVPGGLGSSILIDDVYALDTTTGVNTDFMGDTVVETLYPVSDGTYTQWTPDVAGSHFSRVDEHHLDGNTSYVHTVTAGNKDTYGIGNPVLASTPIYGVQLNLGAIKNDGGARTISPMIRQSGVDYFGPTTSLTANYLFHSWLLDQDPSGSNWLYTTVNADEYGAELVA